MRIFEVKQMLSLTIQYLKNCRIYIEKEQAPQNFYWFGKIPLNCFLKYFYVDMTKPAFLQAEIILCRSSITKSYMPAEVVIKLIFFT